MNGVDVEPAVAVEVEDGDAAAHGLGELPLWASAVLEREDQSALGRDVREERNLRCCRRPRSFWLGASGARGSTSASMGPSGSNASSSRLMRLSAASASRLDGRVETGGQAPPGAGVESSTERLGGARELDGLGGEVGEVGEGPVSLANGVDVCLALRSSCDGLEIAIPGGDVREPLERGRVGRFEVEQFFEGLTLEDVVTEPRSEPGFQLEEPRP